jgi:hypothetical protein
VLGGLYRGPGVHRGGVTAGSIGGIMALTPLKAGTGQRGVKERDRWQRRVKAQRQHL